MNKAQLIDNFLAHSYRSLKENDRFLQVGSSKSYFESFWDTVNNAFSTGLRGYRPPNYTVESFYRGTLDVNEFSLQVRETVINKHIDKLDVNLDPLLTISWDLYSCVPSRKVLCESIPKLCRRQLWGIFNKLDSDGSGFVIIDDIIDVILKIFEASGKAEKKENIKEWFCDSESIDFWCFFCALVETHKDLVTPSTLQIVYDIIFFEILREGKMKKKGHKVANWKERWFVLSTTQLCYYESEENRTLKGSVLINGKSTADKHTPTKDHPYLFRVVDGKSNVPYDISAPDPQQMKDWIETLKVAIAAHSEKGRSVLDKLRLARKRLFPDTLPIVSTTNNASSSSGFGEYNGGVYRVVSPSKPSIGSSIPATSREINGERRKEKELPPIPTSLPDSPSPTYEAIKSGPGPKVKPYDGTKQNSLSDLSLSSSSSSTSPTGFQNDSTFVPSTAPIVSKFSDSVILLEPLELATPDSHTYINVKQAQDILAVHRDESPEVSSPSPPVPPLRIKQDNLISQNSTDFIPVQSHIEQPNDVPLSPTDASKPHYVNFKHVSKDGHDYAVVDKGPTVQPINVQPKPAPVPRKRNVKQTKSLPDCSGDFSSNTTKELDYPILEFGDEGSITTATPQTVKPISPRPMPAVPKQQFDYCEVITDNTTVKDVNTAIQLKANRPPPVPPNKYSRKPTNQAEPLNTEQRTIVNETSIPSSPNDDVMPPPPPPRRQSKQTGLPS